MNALLNLYSPILQWIFPVVLIRLYGFSFFGEFALLMSLITPITIILSLSTKNLYFTKAIDIGSKELYFHLTFKKLMSLVMLLLSYLCFLFELNILSLILFMKMIDFKIDLIILKRASTHFNGVLDIFLVTLSVVLCILSITKSETNYFSIASICFLAALFCNEYKIHIPSFSNTYAYLKKSIQSTVYPLLGAFGVYFQRLFVLSSSNIEFLGQFSICMQFLVAWSLFIQSAFVHLKFTLFESKLIMLFLLVICLIGLCFLENITYVLFDFDEFNISLIIFLAATFLFVFIEFKYFYLFHINKLALIWIPQFVSVLFMAIFAYLVKLETQPYILLVIFSYYFLRCLTFYVLNKINKEAVL